LKNCSDIIKWFIDIRLKSLESEFQRDLVDEDNWPPTVANNPRDLYNDFHQRIIGFSQNITCGSCGVIEHEQKLFNDVSVEDPCLRNLAVQPIQVAYDFSTGIDVLDREHIMLDRGGIVRSTIPDVSSRVTLCKICHSELVNRHMLPSRSLANFRWIGPVPSELLDLSWIEESLVARAHFVGKVVRLQNRTDSFMAIKGHIVLVPQDTTKLLDLLPMSPELLLDTIRVVWVGKTQPTRKSLTPTLSVNKTKVYTALRWLCQYHEDYQNVQIDTAELNRWPDVYILDRLIDTMGRVMCANLEDPGQAGYDGMNMDNQAIQGHLPLSSTAILDVNSIGNHPDADLLLELAATKKGDSLGKMEKIINVRNGQKTLSDYEDEVFFSSAFPTLFPYGSGKHLDSRRKQPLSFKIWLKLLLQHSSRYSTFSIFYKWMTTDVLDDFKDMPTLSLLHMIPLVNASHRVQRLMLRGRGTGIEPNES